MLVALYKENPHNLNEIQEKQFSWESGFIGSLYRRYLGKIKISNVKKINIILIGVDGDKSIIPGDRISPVCIYKQAFDFQHYFNQNKQQRLLILLNIVNNAVHEMAVVWEWYLEPFEEVYRKALECNFVDTFMLNKYTTSPDRQYKAAIQITSTPEYILISVVFASSKGQLLKTTPVLKIIPVELSLYSIVATGRWVGNDEYCISNDTGEINCHIHIDTEKIEQILSPKMWSEKELQSILARVILTSDK